MSHNLSVVSFLSVLAMMLPSLAAEEFNQVRVNNTERVNFAPGGTIRIPNSYGDMSVEGWDRPEVEVTVIKSMPFDYMPQEKAANHLDRVRVVLQRSSDTQLMISTVVPSHGKGGVRIEYQVHVPRDSRLTIHHGTGFVSVKGVTGDIEATAGRGDIMVWLPPGSVSPGAYSIDAKVKFGHVASELEGAAHSQYLIGQRFTRDHAPEAHRVRLRMGFGGITILETKPEAEASAAASAKQREP